MRSKTLTNAAVVMAAVLLFALAACGQGPTPPSSTNVTQNVVVTINPGLTGASPSPAPGSSDVFEVRVGIFGQDCPSGITPPTNSARQIKVGCTAHVTATPRRRDGTDACMPTGTCNASDIQWAISANAPGVVSVSQPSEAFNQDAKGLGPGTVRFTATVKGVTGTLDVEVLS